MPTDMVGEVSVKWVEALQFGLPMAVGGALLGPARFKKPSQVESPCVSLHVHIVLILSE